MSLLSFNETLLAIPVSGPPVNMQNSVAVPMLPPSYQLLLPNHYMKIGRVFRLTMFGVASSFTSGLNIQIQVYMGASGQSAVFTTGGTTTTATVLENVPFRYSGMFTIRTVGASSSTTAYGIFQMQSQIMVGSSSPTVAGQPQILSSPGVTAASAGFISTITNLLSIVLQSSAATASSIQALQFTFESLN